MPMNSNESTERDTIIVEDDALRDGFTQVPNVVLRTTGLTHGAKLAYALLLSYAWGRDRCFPGQERLGADLGVERKAVIRYLKELKDKGVIRVERRGLGRTNVYILPKLADVPILGHLDVPSTGPADDPPTVHKEDSIENKRRKNNPSKIRKASPSEQRKQADAPTTAQNLTSRTSLLPSTAAAEHLEQARRPASQPELIGTTLARRRLPVPVPTYDEDRQLILSYIEDFAREFGDRAPLKSSVSRALHLYRDAGVDRETFIAALYQARAITRERSAAIRTTTGTTLGPPAAKKKFAYFMAVLADLLGQRPAARQEPES